MLEGVEVVFIVIAAMAAQNRRRSSRPATGVSAGCDPRGRGY